MRFIRFISIISLAIILIAPADLNAQVGAMEFRQMMMQQNKMQLPSNPPAPNSGVPEMPQFPGSSQSAMPSGQSSNFAQKLQVPLTQNPSIAPPSSGVVPVTTDSRIKTLVYNANEVYELKFHYGYQSYIEFAGGEEVEMISIGESFAWRLTPAGKRLFVRPLEIGAHTNMTVITNKRTYQFDIASAEYDGRADEELVYIVRFYYPEIGVSLPIPPALSNPNPNVGVFKAAPVAPIVKTPIPPQYINKFLTTEITKSDKKLNFLYSIAGRADNINPLKIFDDGLDTFFQFKDKNLVIPSISSVDLFGNERSLGYAIRETFVVVSGVHSQLTLRLGDKLICVFNEKITSAPSNARADFYQKDFN